jgi:putative ABC transport system substrate-binding protein
MRRVSALVGLAEDDPEGRSWITAFQAGLEKLGWSKDHNIRIDLRYVPGSNPDEAAVLAKVLVATQPDVILAFTTPIVAALKRETSVIPVVFVNLVDPDRLRVRHEHGAPDRQHHRSVAIRGEHRQ